MQPMRGRECLVTQTLGDGIEGESLLYDGFN